MADARHGGGAAMSDVIAEPIRLEPLKEARPSWLKLVKAAASAWVADYAPSMGAALSYYSVFSMAPLLLVVIAIAGLVFGEDAVWRAPVRNRSGGLWGLVRARLLSFGMVLGIAFLLMVSLVMGAAVPALDKWWSGAFAGRELLAQGLNLLIGFVLTTGVFAMIYKSCRGCRCSGAMSGSAPSSLRCSSRSGG